MIPQTVTTPPTAPSPPLDAGSVVDALRSEMSEAVAEGRELRVQTRAAGCGSDVVNPLDGSSSAPDGSGLELGLVGEGELSGGVGGVSGDLNVGALCHDGDGRGGATATCPDRGGGFAADPETSFGATGALPTVAGPEPRVVTAHVVAGYSGGIAPGGRYEGGTMPSSLGPMILGFFYDAATGLLTWDTSGGVSATISGIGTVALSGSVLASPGTYTLTVTGADGSTTTATVTVPADVRVVLVDSVGNVYGLSESGGVWTTEWESTVATYGNPLPAPKMDVQPYHVALSGDPPYNYGWGSYVDYLSATYRLNSSPKDNPLPQPWPVAELDFLATSPLRVAGVQTSPAWDTTVIPTGSAANPMMLLTIDYNDIENIGLADPLQYGYFGPNVFKRVRAVSLQDSATDDSRDLTDHDMHHCLVTWPVSPWNACVAVRTGQAITSLNLRLIDCAWSSGAADIIGWSGDIAVAAPPAGGNAWADPVWFRGATVSRAGVLTYT